MDIALGSAPIYRPGSIVNTLRAFCSTTIVDWPLKIPTAADNASTARARAYLHKNSISFDVHVKF